MGSGPQPPTRRDVGVKPALNRGETDLGDTGKERAGREEGEGGLCVRPPCNRAAEHARRDCGDSCRLPPWRLCGVSGIFLSFCLAPRRKAACRDLRARALSNDFLY